MGNQRDTSGGVLGCWFFFWGRRMIADGRVLQEAACECIGFRAYLLYRLDKKGSPLCEYKPFGAAPPRRYSADITGQYSADVKGRLFSQFCHSVALAHVGVSSRLAAKTVDCQQYSRLVSCRLAAVDWQDSGLVAGC